uniref:Uncharacterized protein n=1 Tax=Anguilla anguilla TaxID=7936 RepID=A0A0E9PCH6_ANGAN
MHVLRDHFMKPQSLLFLKYGRTMRLV